MKDVAPTSQDAQLLGTSLSAQPCLWSLLLRLTEAARSLWDYFFSLGTFLDLASEATGVEAHWWGDRGGDEATGLLLCTVLSQGRSKKRNLTVGPGVD